MNINFKFPTITFPSSVTENEFVSLVLREKKIIAIAAVAFASLVLCFSFIRSKFFKERSLSVNSSPSEVPNSTISGNEATEGSASPGAAPSGKSESKKRYLSAIQRSPLVAKNYLALGDFILPDESIALLDGTVMNRQKLCLRAIEISPNYALAYFNLATTLKNGESVCLPNNQVVNSRDLYVKVIELDPTYIEAYKSLVRALEPGEVIQLDCGIVLSLKELCLKTIELEPQFARAYYRLALTLSRDKKIRLNDGSEMGKVDLYFKAMELKPEFAGAVHKRLKEILTNDESLVMPNGKKVTKDDFEKFSREFMRENSAVKRRNPSTA